MTGWTPSEYEQLAAAIIALVVLIVLMALVERRRPHE